MCSLFVLLQHSVCESELIFSAGEVLLQVFVCLMLTEALCKKCHCGRRHRLPGHSTAWGLKQVCGLYSWTTWVPVLTPPLCDLELCGYVTLN